MMLVRYAKITIKARYLNAAFFLIYIFLQFTSSSSLGREDLVTGTDSPVNMASFTIAVPVNRTASQVMIQLPDRGNTKRSPGTRSQESRYLNTMKV